MRTKYCIALFISVLIVIGFGTAYGITVDIYSGHGTSGGGAPYSGLVGSFVSSDIMFAINTGYAWHPFGLNNFGAEMTGCLQVSRDSNYTFTLNSDDGSLLYIDSLLVVNNGGAHSPQIVSSSTTLTAGLHPFRVEFFEDFGGPSGVDLALPSGVSYASCTVPEPATMLLLLSGIIGLLGVKRRFKG